MKIINRPRHRNYRFFLSIAFFVSIFHVGNVYSAERQWKSVDVHEDETQLAKWFKERERLEQVFEYGVSIGYRKDSFSWSIGSEEIDYLSEIKWSDVKSRYLKISGAANMPNDWYVEGYYGTGAIFSGDAKDIDYSEVNRQEVSIYSKSRARGNADDISFSIGKRIDSDKKDSFATVLPLLGYSVHRLSFVMTEGMQVVPFETELLGLHNFYDARWMGVWAGGEATFSPASRFSLDVRMEVHNVNYSAKADWNLRSDLSHPVSFRHEADGKGKVFSVKGNYECSPHLWLSLSLAYQKWKTFPGIDTTYYSYGVEDTFVLNPINWRSHLYSIGISYRF